MHAPLIDKGFNDFERGRGEYRGPSDASLRRYQLGNILFGVALGFALAFLGVGLVVLYEDLTPEQRIVAQRDVLLSSIPIVALLFTWFHIWLAIQMMFRPLKFFGCCQCGEGIGIGWQGVVPRKALKMAKTAYACARPHLLGPRTWLERCNPVEMLERTSEELRQMLESTILSVCKKHFPGLLRILPPEVLEELTHAAAERVISTSPVLWAEVTEVLAAPEGLDNDKMVIDLFMNNKELLVNFFEKIGAKEFRFIERCGAALGFTCGCIQLVAFENLSPFGRAIFLPATGFFLGIFTNWLAILVCFWPCFKHPIRIFGCHICTIQGLFLKRQPEASEMYSRLLTDNFFNFNYVMTYLQTQPELFEKCKSLYLQHNLRVFHSTIGAMKHIAPLALGKKQFQQLQDDITLELVRRIGEATEMHDILQKYIEVATNIHHDNTRSMQAMSPDQFENLLHPVFKEDEWILIVLGGVLGALVGCGQIWFL